MVTKKIITILKKNNLIQDLPQPEITNILKNNITSSKKKIIQYLHHFRSKTYEGLHLNQQKIIASHSSVVVCRNGSEIFL